MDMEAIGKWCFLIGIILAIVLGLLGTAFPMSGLILVILGLIVGFLNISGSETTPFLIAAIALLVVANSSGLSAIPVIGDPYLVGIISAIAKFTAPAALIVALKAVISASRD